MKEIVNFVKTAGLNDQLPDGFKLVQEVDTQFGTTVAIFDRFVKYAPLLSEIDNEKLQDGLRNLKKSRKMTGWVNTLPLMQLLMYFDQYVDF